MRVLGKKPLPKTRFIYSSHSLCIASGIGSKWGQKIVPTSRDSDHSSIVKTRKTGVTGMVRTCHLGFKYIKPSSNHRSKLLKHPLCTFLGNESKWGTRSSTTGNVLVLLLTTKIKEMSPTSTSTKVRIVNWTASQCPILGHNS